MVALKWKRKKKTKDAKWKKKKKRREGEINEGKLAKPKLQQEQRQAKIICKRVGIGAMKWKRGRGTRHCNSAFAYDALILIYTNRTALLMALI